jgi:SpoVK/Ycf46/Vps4 family AAA+-type ATPase
MARSDLVLNLVRAGKSGNQPLLRQTVEALIAEERAKKHTVLAESLSRSLNENGRPPLEVGPAGNRVQNYLLEISPAKTFNDLILTNATRVTCAELAEEHHRSDLLRSFGMEPRNKVLLVGPPGNGKTTFAEALAESLMVPLFTVRYHAVIASYLGETGSRLRQMFEEVRTRRCVLFFDEFDAIAKERGDIHETGEIKRVVSSLLLEMDALPSYVVVVTATNHAELLDRAVWRRFQIRIMLPKPGKKEVAIWLGLFRKKLDEKLSISDTELVSKLVGLSFAELEEFGNDVCRRRILGKSEGRLAQIVKSSLKEWGLRSSAARSTKRSRINGH